MSEKISKLQLQILQSTSSSNWMFSGLMKLSVPTPQPGTGAVIQIKIEIYRILQAARTGESKVQ